MKKTFIFSLMTLFIYVGCKIDSEETTRNATTTSSDGQSLNAAQQAQKGVMFWEFDAPSNDWIEANQNSKPNCYKIQHSPGCTNGGLIIHTEVNTWQRNKLKTVRQYGAGAYEWRLYVPKLEKGAQTSVNCFLYKDDNHELAIKVYSGKNAERSQMRLTDNQVIAELGGYGMATKKIAITQQDWHRFKIELKLVNGNYHAILTVDGREGKDKLEGTLDYGQDNLFNIFCSVENLPKVGDRPATTPTTGVWDNVKYTPNGGAVVPTPKPTPNPKPDNPVGTYRWHFSSYPLSDWVLANQEPNKNVDHCSSVYKDGCDDGRALKIWTNTGTKERKKLKTKQMFGAGIYTWRVFIPTMNIGERVSVGSWLYNDDQHEVDFEVGSGTIKKREEAHATKNNQLIAYITSQNNPELHHDTEIVTVDRVNKGSWHTFQIRLEINQAINGQNYIITWAIDGVDRYKSKLNYGQEKLFHIFCSVENLDFLGERPTTEDVVGLWDYVTYQPYPYSYKPR